MFASADIHIPAFLKNQFLLEISQGGIVYSDFEPPFHLHDVTASLAHLRGYTQEKLLDMEQFDADYQLKRKDGSYICARPRKCLDWKAPHEVFFDQSLHLT